MFKEAYLYAQMKEGHTPDMYLQSYKYWDKYQEDIKRLFGTGIGMTDRVSLHLRRGDYVGNDFYVDLSKTDYYQRAVALFPDETFLVFCKDNQNTNVDQRDRGWAIDFMDRLKVPFEMAPKDASETDDLNRMASCKGHIMANSSYSWWASFLGNGTTVAPKAWFTDGITRIDLPQEWQQI